MHKHHLTDAPRSKPRRPPNINTSLAAARPANYPTLVTPPSSILYIPDHHDHQQPSNSRRSDAGNHLHPADESFLDNPDPVDADMPEPQSRVPQRDSHDLSYSNRNVTRDSLVTNMLLSLDQFSSMGGPATSNQYAQDDSYDDAPQLFDTSRSWANSVVPNSRHNQSYSSDFDANDDSSRMSSQTSRGRRSNSSSNFHNTYTRLNSVREASHKSQPATPRVARHSRGNGKESKSSSTTSVDAAYSQLHHQQRLARGIGRSASFDHGNNNGQLDNVPVSPFQVEFSNSFLHESYDAAPTPTIPSGPRRVPSTPAMPPPPPPEPKQTVERRRSLSRSLKSSSGRKGLTSRDAASQPPAAALVSPDLDSAPAPHVGYEKTKDAARTGSQNGGTPVPKEKQGFFRRVFGGGSSKTPEPQVQPRATAIPDHSHQLDGNNASAGNTSQSAPPSRDTSSSHSHRPTLQKKSSSFFRRRKKSTADQTPPPLPTDAPPVPPVAPMNLHLTKGKTVDKPEPSPVSSLREVMTPYLDKQPQQKMPLSDITNTPDRNMDSRAEFKREFSPDYEPSPNARIRTVQSDSDHEHYSSPHETPTRPPPARPEQAQERNNSFLNLDGGSDPDEDAIRASRKMSKERQSVKNADTEATLRPKKAPFMLDQTDSEEDNGRASMLALPIEGARATSPASASSRAESKSGTSAPPSVHIEAPAESDSKPSPKVLGTLESMKSKPLDEPNFVIGDPTEDDRQKAQKIFDGNEDYISKEKAASWMGEEGSVRQRTLQAYMELYDFTNLSIVSALRQVCGRLVFRAETQQVDRILVAFSKRWCDSNPNHGFKATDVIHMICYSIMLLNTDLHMADIESKMTRSQFVKNTMTTISQAVKEAAPGAFSRASILPEKNGGLNAEASSEPETKSFRHSFRPPPRTDTQTSATSDLTNDSGPLVKAPFEGSFRAWEEQVEVVLKGTYASIRDERLPLYGAEPDAPPMPTSQSNLSIMGMLKRSPSVLSKAPSESAMSVRGRGPENNRTANARWGSKSRSRPGLGRNGMSSSRTSFEEANSMWSPALSSATWSRYSLGRTHTSVSQDSFAVSTHRGDYQQSIGFANALSQAIIRHDDSIGPDGTASMISEELPDKLLDDESLELAGPPWVKEGMVIHKHHLDGVDRRAKDRNWTEVFAVVQKGQMSLFSFSANKSMRQKQRSRHPTKANAPVGGGNWQDNATSMGTFNLRQTLASALPSPGYSRSRPHVWALSLPTGAVHLFQVGTPEIIKEFVTTANYWSARLSTHPLVGGISNIEYGWGENIVNNSLVMAINESNGNGSGNNGGKESRPESSIGRRSSFQSGRASIRSASIDLGARAFTSATGGGKLPGDRVHIATWAPPTQSMRPSNAREEEQLVTLAAYVKNIEEDLQAHNQLRSPMLLAFTPRGSNANKAMTNWERKSAYLLREIVKYNTYVDCLQQAIARRGEVYGERRLARKAARGELSDGEMEVSGDELEPGVVKA
ncbi:sec7 domain-containing protein [Sarocladium implicatum]|nr:sec7 domain-containing protein [Sarocladium implicatum]